MQHVASLPVTLWQDKLFVPVTIEGTAHFMAVDTGASTTVLSGSVAGALNISHDFDHTSDMEGVGGADSHLYIGEVHRLGVGSITLADTRIPIADFPMRMADGSAAAGLLGADILVHFDVAIDIARRRLDFWRVTDCATVQPDFQGAYSTAPMTIDAFRHVSVPVKIGLSTLELTLDTGAPGLLLTRRAAARAGAPPDILEQDREIGGNGVNNRAFEARLHIFPRLELGSQVFGDVPAAVVEDSRLTRYDGLLGLMFLRRCRVWLSYATGTIFMQPNGT